LAAVRSLTPAASAAAMSDQPSSNTLRQINNREFGQVLALACSFIRVLLGMGWLRHLPASKGARMNNVVRNYS
jgi:hypothetical protein